MLIVPQQQLERVRFVTPSANRPARHASQAPARLALSVSAAMLCRTGEAGGPVGPGRAHGRARLALSEGVTSC